MTALAAAIAIAGWFVAFLAGCEYDEYRRLSGAYVILSFLMITGAFAWATW